MRIIVCGAGLVGSSIARQLASENNDVTIVDQSAETIQQMNDTLDVRAIEGYASHPDVLEQAGARDAEMIVAVTQNDEINMVACQVAHSLFEVPTKIARIRAQTYLDPSWQNLFTRDHMPIDVIISPEIEVARAITQPAHRAGRDRHGEFRRRPRARRRGVDRRGLPDRRHAAAPTDRTLPRSPHADRRDRSGGRHHYAGRRRPDA